METTTLLFERPGPENTAATIAIARKRAEALGIRQFVVASTHGSTAIELSRGLDGLDARVVAVSICTGFEREGWTMSRAERAKVREAGVEVLTATHTLGDDVSEALGGLAPNRVVRETLYRFCQGMKVAVEVALMAADAGLLDTSQEAIAVAGTGDGADTAVVLTPSCSRRFKDLAIHEILAKPR